MKLLQDALANRYIALDLKAQNLPSIFDQVVQELVEKGLVKPEFRRRNEDGAEGPRGPFFDRDRPRRRRAARLPRRRPAANRLLRATEATP